MEYLKSTVMVIEDDGAYRSMYRHVIAEELKARYREADSPIEAVEYMRNNSAPDLIVINTHLPVMDGLSALNLFKTTPYMRTIKYIVTSHEGDAALVSLFADHLIEDYLLKPFDAPFIKKKIIKALDKKHL